MKRFLFLDDDKVRHKHFTMMTIGCDVVHVWTAAECMKVLVDNEPFDCVFLDHDLGGQVYVEEVPGSGTEVAQFIAEKLPAEKLPKEFVIHSWNPSGAERMEKLISARGVPTKRIPFKHLS